MGWNSKLNPPITRFFLCFGKRIVKVNHVTPPTSSTPSGFLFSLQGDLGKLFIGPRTKASAGFALFSSYS